MPFAEPRLGVLLMTYGSPSSEADVPRYLTAVRGGRTPDEAVIREFQRRYRVIGGSPLIRITRDQAAALEAALGGEARVLAAMRFSRPTIADGLGDLADARIERVVAIVLSPQYSPLIMGGYGRALQAARDGLGERAPDLVEARAWHAEPAFIDALAGRIREGMQRLEADGRDRVPVLLTAHSLPKRVADEEPAYLSQLAETARAVASAADLPADRWTFCWQSAGHEPGEWMKPDLAELMPGLRAQGHRSLLVCPVQFLADHLEVLYDLDVAARALAEASGLRLARVDSLNADARLIEALASVVRRHVGSFVMARG